LTDEEKQRFIIQDNISGGEWDWEILANEWIDFPLADWGLDLPDDEKIDKMEDGEVLGFEQSVQIAPPKEYVLIMAEPNSVEWEQMKEMLKLKMVRRGGYRKGSPFDDLGIERVIRWDEFKKRINVNSDTK
jgi:hypothetical protein